MRQDVIGAGRAAGRRRAALGLVGGIGGSDGQRAAPIRGRFGRRGRAGPRVPGGARRSGPTGRSAPHAAGGGHADLAGPLGERNVFTFPGKQNPGKTGRSGVVLGKLCAECAVFNQRGISVRMTDLSSDKRAFSRAASVSHTDLRQYNTLCSGNLFMFHEGSLDGCWQNLGSNFWFQPKLVRGEI